MGATIASTAGSKGLPDPARMDEARNLVQNAMQWLARIANSYCDGDPMARTLLTWNADHRTLSTGNIAPGIALQLQLPDLAMQFTENGKPAPHRFPFEDHSPAETEAWILVELLHRGVDRDRFSKALPYSFDRLMTGDAHKYEPETLVAELTDLAAQIAAAANVLQRAATDGKSIGAETAPPVLCWPDRFHLGVIVPVDPDGPSAGRCVRVGYAPGDGLAGEPAYYVRPYSGDERGHVAPAMGIPASRIARESLTSQHVADLLHGAITDMRKRMSN